jgi:hypothetical protein
VLTDKIKQVIINTTVWKELNYVYGMKEAVSQLPSWAKVCPKHVELILEINKTVILASS